jgi:hypothetical protein
MIQLFYHITANKDGGFTYHEFNCGASGGYGFVFNDAYRDFNTHAEALSYAKQRGGVDAYGY